MVSSLKCIRDKDEIASTIGDFIRHRVPTVINVDISPTETDSEYLRVILTPNIKLGLPDLSYYEQGFSKTRIISAYASLLKRLGDEFNVAGLEQIFGIEEIIANSIHDTDVWSDIITTRDELKNTYKNIPWDVLFQSIFSWKQNEKHTIVIKNKRY